MNTEKKVSNEQVADGDD